MHVVEVAINLIQIGERRREDFGDIPALAAGIKKVGLLEPIVVDESDDGIRLVCGERRLRAVSLLGWKTIPAHLRQDLSDEQLREIELEENDNRKNLTERERARRFKSSKKLIEQAKQVAEKEKQNSVVSTESHKPGPKPKYGVSRDVIANDLGISEGMLRQAEQHVATAEQFPFMQGNDWRQSHVLAVHESMEHVPAEEQAGIASVLGCARILAPTDAVNLVTNMVAMKPEERQELYTLSASTDPRDRSLALSRASLLPPLRDPRLTSLDAALDSLRRAAKPFPDDPLTPRIAAVIRDVTAIRAAVKEVSYDARRKSEEKIQ